MINEKEFNKIVAQNLRNLIYERDKNQATVAKELGINKATLSSWMNGTRTPKMANIDMLCEYFGVPRSAIMEPSPHRKTQHISEDQAQLIQLAMNADSDNVHLILEVFRRMEGLK